MHEPVPWQRYSGIKALQGACLSNEVAFARHASSLTARMSKPFLLFSLFCPVFDILSKSNDGPVQADQESLRPIWYRNEQY
jgi:hypothetical protein